MVALSEGGLSGGDSRGVKFENNSTIGVENRIWRGTIITTANGIINGPSEAVSNYYYGDAHVNQSLEIDSGWRMRWWFVLVVFFFL